MLASVITIALVLLFASGLFMVALARRTGWRLLGGALAVVALVAVFFMILPGGYLSNYWFPTTKEPTEVSAPAPDYCADQVNPAWGALIEKNSLQAAVYEAWLADVVANGGLVYGASKCSLPVDSRVFGPDDEVAGSGPAQLVSEYRFTAIWHPSVNAEFTLASGCTFEPLFSQGDAPVAVYRSPGTITMQNNVSNGVSLVGIVTCR